MVRIDAASCVAVALLGTMVLAACLGNDDYATTNEERTDRRAREVEPRAASFGQLDPADFVHQASAAGEYEVRAAELALAKGVRPEVESLARMLQRDHEQANQELRTIAGEMQIPVWTGVRSEQQALLDELEGLSGLGFEDAYLRQQQRAHEQAIELFERAQDELPESRLATFAGRTLAKLREHLQMVEREM